MAGKEKFDIFKFIAKNRVFLVYAFVILFFLFSNPTKASVLFGIIFCLIGEVIRTLAVLVTEKKSTLTTSGPYGYVRNPLYLGSFLIGLGVCIMGNVFMFTIIFIPVFLIIYFGIIKTEEGELQKVFKEKFNEYALNVPGFLPRFTPWGDGESDFKLSQLKEKKEYLVWLGIYAVTIIMFLKT
jgi:protein-S-isoprenylcysteine O-methyltransferase Ste14